MYAPRPTPRRRGCIRGCAGCLLHHPITLLATFFAFVLWLPHLVHVTLYIAAGTEPDPWPLVWTTLLLVAAQLIPRITPMLYRAYLAQRARVRDRQLQRAHATSVPPLDASPSSRVSVGTSTAAHADYWSVLGYADGAAVAHAVSGATPPWREYRDRLWTADANASTYRGSVDDADVRAMGAGNTAIRLIPDQAPESDSLLAASYGQPLTPDDLAHMRPGGPVPYIRLFAMRSHEDHNDE